MANHSSIRKRQLLVLMHLFDEVYDEQQLFQKNFFMVELNEDVSPSVADYYKMIAEGEDDDRSYTSYGTGPLPNYIRFNDVKGILYKINKLIKDWKKDLGNFIWNGISANDLEEIEYSTLVKGLDSLIKKEKVLVKTDGKNIKHKSFYFPDESIEGYNNFLEYLIKLPYGPSDEFGIGCRKLAFSNYSHIVLNREFVIQNMRKKNMLLMVGGLMCQYPYMGHYKKIFECPEPIDKLISKCKELLHIFPDFECTDGMLFRKTVHQVISDLIADAETYRSRINDIQSRLSEVEQNEDQLARLHPKDWFTLDPDSKLRREAQWSFLELTKDDKQQLFEIYLKNCNKKESDITVDEWRSFLTDYISRVEMDVLYTLCMISNSYWALMYFHCYQFDNFYKIQKEGADPYSRLPGPSVTNRTGRYGWDDMFWDKQLYRFAMFDYSLGTHTDRPNGPSLMGIGPIEYDGKVIPTTFSFRITPNCFLTASGLLNRDVNSDYPLDVMENMSTHKNIDKTVYGSYYSQSYLLSLFRLPHMYENNLDDVLKQLMLDIDCYGNCKYDAQHYLDLFKDERPEYKKRRGW